MAQAQTSVFADLIRGRRKALEMTLADVTEHVGWSIPYQSELERGAKQPPTGAAIDRLAAALQLDVHELRLAAEMSRRSVEIDLGERSAEERQLAVLLARQLERGLSEEKVRQLIAELNTTER